ncbi:CLOCK-interacting pacemaker [Python bivittatus]|uniref:CLOCK-interacting pacemaker n=1 Tax=Python bivittatus TaxID=176946 RepID=A0A9F5IUM5_PYTBI|nr:CLOCK-interacting pacemaker [Python bivittatus]XP_015746329.1 CLOCK-interacting pacemaker [Python bivittatus]XP_025031930.1 CLOCK-interacting pacemaker [Python bivittatus]
MPSSEPSSSVPSSRSTEEKMSPSVRLRSKWGCHVGRPERMERATHNGIRKPSHPVSEGEKDSGFSDESSEYLSAIEQTDAEDQPASPLPPWPAKLQKAMGGLMGSTFPSLAPVYLVKNVILKQTLGVSPTAPFLAWSSQRPLESAHSSAAHIFLIQDPMASLKPLLPSQKLSAKETRFPTLGTYPRIAPHPGHGLQAGEAPSPVGDTSKDRLFCVGEDRASPGSPTTKDRHEKLQEEPPTSPQASALRGPEVPARPILPSCAGLDLGEGRVAFKASKRLGGNSLGRQRRLHNTVEVLRKSGLLGITLRTKELLRQNSGTQRDLAELREHAQLLCEAVQSNDSRVWARLQDAIDRSAAYWPSQGAGAQACSGQQQNLAAQPLSPLPPRPGELPSGSGLALGRDTDLPTALP